MAYNLRGGFALITTHWRIIIHCYVYIIHIIIHDTLDVRFRVRVRGDSDIRPGVPEARVAFARNVNTYAPNTHKKHQSAQLKKNNKKTGAFHSHFKSI